MMHVRAPFLPAEIPAAAPAMPPPMTATSYSAQTGSLRSFSFMRFMNS
jgi:hypothetical protein